MRFQNLWNETPTEPTHRLLSGFAKFRANTPHRILCTSFHIFVHGMFRRVVMGTIMLATLAGCSPSLTVQRRYVGTLQGCDATMTATLTRIGNDFVLAPSDGSLLIRGTVAADGSLTGVLNTQPGSKQPYLMKVTGHAEASAVTVTYVTPHCTAQGTLALRPVRLMP